MSHRGVSRDLAYHRDGTCHLPQVQAAQRQQAPTCGPNLFNLDLLEGGGQNGRPLSRRTVDYVHATLHKAFNDAVRPEALLASNPAERAKRPRRTARPVPEVWTAQYLRVFLEHTQDHRLIAFYRLAAYTGARRGELLALR